MACHVTEKLERTKSFLWFKTVLNLKCTFLNTEYISIKLSMSTVSARQIKSNRIEICTVLTLPTPFFSESNIQQHYGMKRNNSCAKHINSSGCVSCF